MQKLTRYFTKDRRADIEKQVIDMIYFDSVGLFTKYIETHDIFYALIDKFNDDVMSLGLDPYACVIQAATVNNSFELITKLNTRFIIIQCEYSKLKL